ncbi:acetyl-CoA carboxylase biotin carboxylase subunit [Anaerorhabdus furcosa]|uniref:Biotin carboxylase n=1 Tax=Anaerorhabdus furcosa TaxID=118967 RepID=A0A1T4KPK0_9FIRM|nr:acetyl-CoA carboxylase biotin carboxylase subunit [Anaerorhabdus furcosa]SJZ44342.1 acetyl-CoA carboxylase, biotin carboxylase subunit [Anaerorhabdus furcosa]
MIKKILIANRGEIAVRIIRTCKLLNINTVAVYSTADKEAYHTQLADESICIGDAPSKNSYLNMDSIIEAAKGTGADAIHPGFGFLSENSTFARKVIDAGIIFIGPEPEVIDRMGDKSNARASMIAAGVSVVPGSKECIATKDDCIEMANKIGYPVIIKASSGGGGRGMRIVYEESDCVTAYEQARSEALISFGDDSVYMEKYLVNPKHIEVQLLGDKHGNVVHLFERDCSMQRRNQKTVEEAPCDVLTQEAKERLYADAIKAAKYVNYDSVGTIEFLVDHQQNHYFMEMNTRIQVEHTISEMITGLDLIKQQIRVAEGKPLEFTQDEITLQGHAIECRINAENVKANFAPNPGTIKTFHVPGGQGIRIDSAVYAGYTIPPFYDSMILKLIVHAPTRLEAIKRMRVALEELLIEGVETNIEFQYLLFHDPIFVSGRYDTSSLTKFIEEVKKNELSL